MYEDVPTSNIPNKTILIQLVNQNVIPFSYLRNLKTPTVAILLGFFFVLICDELCDEQVMNNFLSKSQFKTTNVIVVKSSDIRQILK